MIIETRRSNFSQFTKDCWLKIYINDLSIDYDLSENEIKDFCLMLMSLSSEILFNSNIESSEVEEFLDKSVDILNEIEKEKEK